MKKKLIVMSFDALGDIDSEVFEKLPGFRYLIDNGAYIKKVKSVYPTLTYACHASISTGRYPREHGIINNLLLQPSKEKMDWYWYEKNIQGDTLFRAARRRGLKTAAVLWPVSAKGNIDYNIAEIIPHRPWHNQVIVSLLNSNPMLVYKLDKKFGHLRKGLSQPELDNFIEACFLDLIKTYGPDVIMAHFIAVDEMKHNHGIHAQEVKDAILTYDERIRNVVELLESRNELANTNLIVLSDHSQIDLKTGLRVNSFLNEKGYFKLKGGKINKFDAIMHEAGGAAYIYSKHMDHKSLNKLRAHLEEFREKYEGIEEIYTSEEAEAMGADPECAFMLEAEAGYYFIQDMNGEIVDHSLPHHKATHGYSPDKPNYSAVFFAIGPDFKNITIENANLVDIAPTISKAMDLGLEGATGRRLTEILV